MDHAWSRGSLAAGMVLIAAGVMTGAPSARAEFYDLTGRYECLGEARRDLLRHDADAPRPAGLAVGDGGRARRDADRSAAEARQRRQGRGRAGRGRMSANPYQDTIDRIQARKPTEGDIALLESHAKTGEAAAIELLAWCEYSGVGVKTNPVHAYFLYGEAAEAGAPKAHANQQLIYGRVLSQEQRQQILDIQNGRTPRNWP